MCQICPYVPDVGRISVIRVIAVLLDLSLLDVFSTRAENSVGIYFRLAAVDFIKMVIVFC